MNLSFIFLSKHLVVIYKEECPKEESKLVHSSLLLDHAAPRPSDPIFHFSFCSCFFSSLSFFVLFWPASQPSCFFFAQIKLGLSFPFQVISRTVREERWEAATLQAVWTLDFSRLHKEGTLCAFPLSSLRAWAGSAVNAYVDLQCLMTQCDIGQCKWNLLNLTCEEEGTTS